MRSATKEFLDEVNLVTDYTGKRLKIQVCLISGAQMVSRIRSSD
jgi:hypothetical protein